MTAIPGSLGGHLQVTHSHRLPSGSGNIAKFLLWSNFVDTAVNMLNDAARRLADPVTAAGFKAKTGWYRKTPSSDGNGGFLKIPDEDAITDALVELMKRARAAPDPTTAFARHSNVAVSSQQKRRKQERIGGKGRLNTDIAIYLADQTALDLMIEAKVLANTADVANAYCSGAGLLRFADRENPYTIELVGGMVAYCFVHPKADWDASIAATVQELPEVDRTARVAIAGAGEELLVTDVLNGGDISVVTVFHLGMEFTTEEAEPVRRSARPRRERAEQSGDVTGKSGVRTSHGPGPRMRRGTRSVTGSVVEALPKS